MKKVLCLALMMVLCMPMLSLAATVKWKRNTEADMNEYRVYGCKVKDCTVQRIPTMLLGTVPQTAVGVDPQLVVDLSDTEGKVAIVAVDLSGNPSGLSVQVPFDYASPQASVGVEVIP